MDQMLYNRLGPVIRRLQIRRVATTLAVVWVLAALVALFLFYRNYQGLLEPSSADLVVRGYRDCFDRRCVRCYNEIEKP